MRPPPRPRLSTGTFAVRRRDHDEPFPVEIAVRHRQSRCHDKAPGDRDPAGDGSHLAMPAVHRRKSNEPRRARCNRPQGQADQCCQYSDHQRRHQCVPSTSGRRENTHCHAARRKGFSLRRQRAHFRTGPCRRDRNRPRGAPPSTSVPQRRRGARRDLRSRGGGRRSLTPSKCIADGDDVTRAGFFPQLRQLGVRTWSSGIQWRSIAPEQPANPTDPNDPAYQWPADLERNLDRAVANGVEPILYVNGFPRWSNGGLDEDHVSDPARTRRSWWRP